MIKFNTGRNYGQEQILEIEAPGACDDELAFVPVRFNDTARRIRGVVTVLAFECDARADIGRAVLREYDAGRYIEVAA